MSKKHFVAIASHLRRVDDLAARQIAADAISEIAQSLNPRFDKSRFMTACGL